MKKIKVAFFKLFTVSESPIAPITSISVGLRALIDDDLGKLSILQLTVARACST
jgi:hypothetical protein